MKRLSEQRKSWLKKVQAQNLQQRQRRVAARKGVISVMRPTNGGWRAIPSSKNITMPSSMSFDDDCGITLTALSRVRHRLLLPMKGVRLGPKSSKHRSSRLRQASPYFQFENIKNISTSVALVLAADFEGIKLKTKSAPIVYNVEAWSPSVISRLWSIGFFDIVGVPTGMSTPDPSSEFRILPMRSGETADSVAVGKLIEDLRGLYPGEETSSPDGLVHLFGAMVEAVVNVSRHAYPADHPHDRRSGKRWWMTGAVDRQAGWTTAVIYDQGITIPVSLPSWDRYAGFLKRCQMALGIAPSVGDHKSDGAAIAIAVEEAISSTEEPHRGNGLGQMREFVAGCRDGYLRIMSRCGEVVYRPNGSPEVKTHEISIGGTLIEWNVLI